MVISRSALPRLTFVLALAACGSSCARPALGDALLRRLEEKQFLLYAGANGERMRAEIKEKGWPAIFGDSGRTFGADNMTLAKGGVSAFVSKLRPFLEKQGAKIPDLKDEVRRESYSLLVDGVPLPIWTRDDLARELGAQPGITSGIAAARSFALVNKLLEGANSPERAYAIYSGAALSVMFLTEDLMTVIKTDPLAVPKFMPYRPTTDFPFFGQPQT